MTLLERLETMLARGQDNALMRFGLGGEHLKLKQYDKAIEHLHKAVEHDPRYSAAWKLLGKAFIESGQREKALAAYENGIKAAEEKGDMQAVKEMRVFLKRLQK